ncbi:MAG: ABC-2 family transporter protein [bacterium]
MNATIEFKPSLMQKLLGRNYKWWYLTVYSFKQSNIRLSSFLIGNFASVLDFAITIYLWLFIDPTADRITYFFVGFILQRLIWSQYFGYFSESIISGKIVNRLLIPVSNTSYWFFREIGSSVIRNLISASLIFTFLPFYINYLKLPTLNFVLLILPLLAVSFIIDFLVSYILASIAFWTEDIRPISYLAVIIIKVLSGIAIPFSFLPAPYNWLLQYNPYSMLNYHPMQIYLGKYDTNQTIFVFIGGLLWCLILYFLAKLVFKLGLKRNESVGL